MLSNLFLNDQSFWLRSELHNFANDNTTSATYKSLQQLIKQESESATAWKVSK